MSTRKVLADVVNAGIDRMARSMRVCMPGRIEKFNATEQTADVKPLLQDRTENEDGSEGSVSVDVICRVPVHVAGGGGFAITFPIAKGDECLLVFGDRSLDNWFLRGGDQDPVDLRRHALSDAVAIVGIRAEPNKLAEYDTARTVLGKVGGKKLALTSSELHLGVDHNESATDSVALASLVVNELKAIRDDVASLRSTLSGHTHDASTIITSATVGPTAVVGVQSGMTGPGPTLSAPPSVGEVKSACVKSK